jgi:hypothetical protein
MELQLIHRNEYSLRADPPRQDVSQRLNKIVNDEETHEIIDESSVEQ